MKIQNDGSTGAAPLETTRMQPAPFESNGGASSGRTITGQDGDSVQISGLSSQVSAANAADTQQRANRVDELAAVYARGNYQVNSAHLSQAVVSHSLHGSHSPKA